MMRKYAAALALASSMLCGAPAAPGAGIGPAAAHQGSAAVTTGPSSLPAPDDDRVSAPARAPGARALTGWHPFVQDTVNRVAVDDSPAAPWRLHMVARRLADRPDGWHVSAAVVGESLGPLRPATEYVLRFRAWASRQRALTLDLAQHPGSYRNLGLLRTLPIDATPRDYAVGFRTDDSLPAPSGAGPSIWLTVGAGGERGEVWVGPVVLEPMARRRFEGPPITIGSFAPGEWSEGEIEDLHARQGGTGLTLEAPANGGRLATCEISLDLSAGGWDFSLSVYTDTPRCIGRVIVLARSGSDQASEFTYGSFSGLEAGWNRVLIPRELFISYSWIGLFSWAEVRTIGIKLESNGNGPARATFSALGVAPHDYESPTPFVSHVMVDSVGASAVSVRWETSSPSRCELDFGPSTAYGKRWIETRGPATDHAAMLSGLEPGRIYHCRVRGVAGAAVASGDFTFATDPERPWIAGGDSTDLDLGLSAVNTIPDLERVRRTPFNCFSSYHFCPDSDGQVARYLDLAAASRTWVSVGFCSEDVVHGNLGPVIRRVRRLAAHPGLLGWYLYDEPERSAVDPAALKAAFDAIRHEDPAHPVLMGSFKLSRTYPYRDAFDLAFVSCNPIPFAPVDSIVPTIERARASGKRFEFVFQSYSTELQRWPGSKPGPGRYPSRDEMRAMAYLGVVHGASGLWTWAYSYIQDAPGSEWHWTELLSLARELRLLGPLLASPSVGDARANISDSAVHACLKAYRGMDYLITVNASPARTAAQIRLEARPLSTARELFSDRATPVRGGEIADEWSGYDVRIYELGPG